jgi:hypothetical protein
LAELIVVVLTFLETAEIEAKLVHDGIDERSPGSSEGRSHKLGHGIGKRQKSFECEGWEWLDPYA